MKEYLLLRKNVQSGPFTINDLLAKQLQPTDLIWVEGSSITWRYPEEIEELAGYADAGICVPAAITVTGTAEAVEPVTRQKAVVAIRPSDNKLSIKTVKTRPNLLKVEIREEEPEGEIIPRESYIGRKAPVQLSQVSSRPASRIQPVHTQTAVDNRIEFFVLAVGAVSLLAVLYLLVTTSY